MSAEINFDQLGLSSPILQAVKDIGYESPSPIQAASIPILLKGQDLLGQAQTGTGKTAAFALPLLSQIDLSKSAPQILVLAPTRELAIQVAEAFQTYARNLKGFHVLPIYGGQSMQTQLRQLKRGVHVVIGTPGRIMDHLRRKSLQLNSLKSLVLDEADEMLKMGFIEDVEWILEQSPKSRQIALFSATMPEAIRKVARQHLNAPQEVKIKSKTSTVDTITQRYWLVSGLHKLDALTRILEVEDFDACIIFVRTKSETVNLAEKLEARGFATGPINGDMSQEHRERTINQLKKEKLDIVVATDVAARGLDVKRITHVINFDIPYDTESYVHRIGRTGRAGAKGNAILFVAPREKRMLYAIEKATKQPIERMQLPSSENVTDRRIKQFKQQMLDVIESEDLEFYYDVVRQLKEELSLSASDLAAALTYLVQKERPLKVIEPKQVKQQPAKNRPVRDKQDYEKGAIKSRDKGRHGGEKPNYKSENKTDFKRTSKSSAPRLKKHPEVEMMRYRIEVGKNQGAMPKDIVGAIANEAGVDGDYIGHIKLHDDFSIIDLPEGMPKDTFQHLKNVRIKDCKLEISVDGSTLDESKPSPSRRKDSGRKGRKDSKPTHRKGQKSGRSRA